MLAINGSENFIIEDLVYIPTGEYMPVFNRPYMVNVTKSAIDTVVDRMYDTKSGKITPNIINGVASDIIQPSSVGYGTAINNDWLTTKKFIFMMKVKTVDMAGVEITSYIQGYTDYNGITSTGNIDGQLNHYINNVIETTTMIINTPLGVIRKEKLYKIYNIFFNNGVNEVFTQRPTDVLENIELMNYTSMMDKTIDMSSYLSTAFMNTFDKKSISSNIDNNITTNYLSNILTAGMLDNKNKEIHVNSYDIGTVSAPDKYIPEPSINDNRFLKYLSRSGGYNSIVSSVFNFQQLLNIDPSVYGRFKVLNITKDYVNPVMQATPDVGDYWHGQDPVTVKAYSLIENSVSLALKYGFNKLYFTASNMTNPTGVAEVFITNFNSFINLEEQDFNYILEIFKSKFINDIFLNESNSGTTSLHMEVYVDLLGTTKINLSYAGYPSNWYTIPTFANSLFSPIVTVDKNAVDYMSFQLNSMISTLSTEFVDQKSYY